MISLSDKNVSRFLPYFFRYKEYGEYPDGQGMLLQPVKLLSAFAICSIVSAHREKIEIDRIKNAN